MGYLIIKTGITAILIVAISEISRRNTWLGAILASVPLVSVLAMLWMYRDTHKVTEIISLSHGILWLILPSLAFFIVLPILLQHKMQFYSAIVSSLGIMILCYFMMIMVLRWVGVKV